MDETNYKRQIWWKRCSGRRWDQTWETNPGSQGTKRKKISRSMRRGRAAAGGRWNKQTGKHQSTRTRVSRKATTTGFSTNWEKVERPPHHPAWKPNTQVTEREGETTGQDLNFFFLLLFPLRIKVYLKVYYTAPTTDYVGTIISLDRSTGGVSACLAFLPVAPPMGPLCRLQGHQLGATLHQYFILSSQNISKWKSHGREISPPYPAACLRSSYSPHTFSLLWIQSQKLPCSAFSARSWRNCDCDSQDF